MEEGCTAFPALCASCTGYLLEARSTGPHARWGIGFILPRKWRVFIYLILYVTHLIVNGLRQLMCISKAVRAQSPLCCLLTGISPPRFHIYSDAILTSDDNRDCTIHLPVYFFYCSAVIFWRGVLSYHNHFICTSVPHKMLSDFSFAKLAQAAFCKGRAPRLV